jgi:hypothetical protein
MLKLFWLILVMFTLGWYLIVTWIVAIKGYGDIRKMLESLSEANDVDNEKKNRCK